MTEKHQHLELSEHTNFGRKKQQGFPRYQKAKNIEDSFKTQIKNLDSVHDDYKKYKEKYIRYFDPRLIFKINVFNKPKKVHDETFRNDLKEVGIVTISSAPDKRSYWVAFDGEDDFEKFREKLKKRRSTDESTFIDAIRSIETIPPKEKLSKSLIEKPLVDGKVENLDVEIWRMEDERLDSFISDLTNLIKENNGEKIDESVTDNFCVIRVKCDRKLLSQIIEIREISFVDRPLYIKIEKKLQSKLPTLEVSGSPDKNKPGILIVDSGIRNHPLLKNAIADSIVIPSSNGKIRENIDDAGHGTEVAGIALYGDVRKCIDIKKFDPQIWLYSAKVMYSDEYGNAIFDLNSLVENQLKDAVEKTIKKHLNCKIINISLGNSDKKMLNGRRQFRIASLIDELSMKYTDILFTIATGNVDEPNIKRYPYYLMEDTEKFKIIDPATSAHGITVGSIFSLKGSKSTTDLPSQFTCVGPGLQEMIKPELVDYGGSRDADLITVNWEWLIDGRLFTRQCGTSFSAPKIAHYLARLKDAFPNDSRNYLKALLISSAIIPVDRPRPLNKIDYCNNDEELRPLLNIYGYGKPDLNRAQYSESNRVLLTYDGKIGLDCVALFTINLPNDFLITRGKRSIEVTLAFDPPVNSNRADYLGVTMEYHLFRNLPVDDIKKSYKKINLAEQTNDIVPKKIQKQKFKMRPGSNIRKKGIHQKSIIEYKIKPKINIDKPLVLAVICQKKWFKQEDYQQSYSVIVTFKHEQEFGLYNMIKSKNPIRSKARIR